MSQTTSVSVQSDHQRYFRESVALSLMQMYAERV